jgi:hypothetical protein
MRGGKIVRKRRSSQRVGLLVLVFVSSAIAAAVLAPRTLGSNGGGDNGGWTPACTYNEASGTITAAVPQYAGEIACRGARIARYMGFHLGCPNYVTAGSYTAAFANGRTLAQGVIWQAGYCADGLYHWSSYFPATTDYRVAYTYWGAPRTSTNWDVSLWR